MSNSHDSHSATGHETQEHGAHHMPDPSIFPLVLAIGITLVALSTVLGLTVLIVGLIVFAIGMGGWLTEDTKTHLKARRQKQRH